MSTPPLLTDPQLIAYGRELDAALWPAVDRICARLGMTRAELLALPHPAAALVEPCSPSLPTPITSAERVETPGTPYTVHPKPAA